MVRRNKLRSGHMIGMEMDQRSWAYHPPPDLGVPFGSITNFPQLGIPILSPAPGNSSSAFPYGMTHYNGVPHHHHATNLELCVGAPNYCYPNMPPYGSRVFPVTADQGMEVVSMTGFAGHNHFMDGSASSSKTKNLYNVSSFAFPEYRGNDNRSRAMGVPTPDDVIQENYVGPPGSPWLGPVGTSAWSQAHALIYMQGAERPQYLPPIHQVQHNLHNVLPPMQGPRGLNINVHPQGAGSSHTGMIPFQDSGRRHVGPIPPIGVLRNRPQRRGVMLEATARHHNLPQLRVLPVDEVAILDIPSYYEVGNSIDQHRDMRLDIDHMSYEELLALGERIGEAGSGILEETILAHLKTRTYLLPTTCTGLEGDTDVDYETNFCVICQIDYKNEEKIGTLDCGHEYHFDCIKKWLRVKNTCPICKSSALTTEAKDL